VMSLECFIGPEGNLLESTEKHAHRLCLPHPILSNKQLSVIRHMDYQGMRSQVIDMTFDARNKNGFHMALERMCQQATQAISDGYSFIILSDRGIAQDQMAVSALVACGAVHHHLVNHHLRTRIGIILETGEAREVHHHCLLTGYGADGINPYLAFEALWQANQEGLLGDDYPDEDSLIYAYKKAVAKGMMKVMGKMGISTLQSYKGAQIFEAVGLASEIIDRCFIGTPSRIQGVNFEVLIEETLRRHRIGFPVAAGQKISVLPNPGDFHWRSGGDAHMWNPSTIFNLQVAARNNSAEAYKEFARQSNEVATRNCSIRGLLKFRTDINKPVPLEEVEAASEIVKRFATGAMSLGAISTEAHESLAIAMNRIGGKSNTGEGGEDSVRYQP
ncbi:MAG: glutamate synthase central domain-containing protein, partial [Pseudohongiellaceae bacterium]